MGDRQFVTQRINNEAAPDLLKAAKRALAVIRAGGSRREPGNVIAALEDAIAKAEAK